MKKLLFLILWAFSAVAFAQNSNSVQVTCTLQGRSANGSMPSIANVNNISGVIVVDIWVDQYGTVQKAVSGAEGSTITDEDLLNSSRKSALGAHFNMSTEAPALQKGQMKYTFRAPETKKGQDEKMPAPVQKRILNIVSMKYNYMDIESENWPFVKIIVQPTSFTFGSNEYRIKEAHENIFTDEIIYSLFTGLGGTEQLTYLATDEGVRITFMGYDLICK